MGSFFGRHSRPLVLKSPISSFFFESTEITGTPLAMKSLARLLMCSNCALRSGWSVPSRVFDGACRLYPDAINSFPIFWGLIGPRLAEISLASARVLLHVQRRGDSGSPRLLGSTSESRAATSSRSWFSRLGRPPPRRRTRTSPSVSAPRRNSLRPARTVLIASPVASATAATPPWPNAPASAPAHSLRCRSSSAGLSNTYLRRIASRSIFTATVDHKLIPTSIVVRSTCFDPGPDRVRHRDRLRGRLRDRLLI